METYKKLKIALSLEKEFKENENEKLIEELIQSKLREQEIYKSLSLDGAMDAFFALTERGIDP